ncbi:MAG: UDP-glucose/GDP-mannose dehydrogenase family protein, partial [Crocinitomicaceae bacterium]|nr:UDP-glucose/GDP-mannose dehydrogenase family protein [Crocinitomicaceae bacterium]
GKRFLFPGIGYGGSCFPKDVQALVKSGEDSDYRFSIIDAVLKVNDEQKLRLIEKVKNHFGDLAGKSFALWGLAFKPDTDDIREAPALYMIDALLAAGADVIAFDPEAMDNVRKLYGEKITFVKNQYDALNNADALLIATEWGAFRNPNFGKIKELLNEPKIFDGRNLFDLDEMKDEGFYYESIGRRTVIG